ncbi:hypothetical protein Hamer_G010838 [Homarus americanus]|uniref:Uncharacterized protein n=1 Tax=Homarus americanus TaxID=6706 RepID=A0A8J5MSW8_HOMAM|nr:hypothetical protein Hamer_G010838 [Homarus americanus]
MTQHSQSRAACKVYQGVRHISCQSQIVTLSTDVVQQQESGHSCRQVYTVR